MGNAITQYIWQPATGITDFEVDAQSLSASEIPFIKSVWGDQRRRLNGTSQLLEFTDRISREWAIETGIIENLYDIERGVTQTLIERGFQAELLSQGSTNRPREYVIQLLRDQKDALDGIFDFVSSKRELSVSYIKDLHAALLRSQSVTEAIDASGNFVTVELIRGDWKTRPNYPLRDGIVYAYCPPEQVASEMDRLIEIHDMHVANGIAPDVEAAWLHHRFSQIHPFQDGNGRVARAIASLLLIKEGLFPLVVTRDDKPAYLDALEAADRRDLKPLIDLFAKLQRVQFRKATAISEAILSADANVQQLLGNLSRAAAKLADEKLKNLRRVFDHAGELASDIATRLNEIVLDIVEALEKIARNSAGYVETSNSQTDHYFRAQIIENAKNHLNYYANTAEYRAWVALHLRWERSARLVFAIHGIGRPFSGTLICAPFLEFRDRDDDNLTRSTLIPVTEEGFLFFHDETSASILQRFRPWREDVLKIALQELTKNL